MCIRDRAWRVEQLDRKLHSYQELVRKLETDLEQAEGENQSVRASLCEHQLKAANNMQDVKQRISALTDEKDEMASREQQLLRQEEELRHQLKKLQQQIHDERQDRALVEQERAGLARQLQDLKASSSREAGSAERTLTFSEQRISQLEVEKEGLVRQVASLTGVNKALSQQIVQLDSQLSVARENEAAAIRDQKQVKQRVSGLEMRLHTRDASSNQLQQRVDQLEPQNYSLSQRLSEAVSELDRQSRLIQTQEAESTNLTSKLSALQRQNQSATAQVQSERDKICQLVQEETDVIREFDCQLRAVRTSAAAHLIKVLLSWFCSSSLGRALRHWTLSTVASHVQDLRGALEAAEASAHGFEAMLEEMQLLVHKAEQDAVSALSREDHALQYGSQLATQVLDRQHERHELGRLVLTRASLHKARLGFSAAFLQWKLETSVSGTDRWWQDRVQRFLAKWIVSRIKRQLMLVLKCYFHKWIRAAWAGVRRTEQGDSVQLEQALSLCDEYRHKLFRSFYMIWLAKREAQQQEAIHSVFIWWRDLVDFSKNHELENVVNHFSALLNVSPPPGPVSYTHLRAHETPEHLVCRLLLEKKKKRRHTQILTMY
eukprot:TRINITY_DN54982_c0_g1_i1.p1 TRINITY_DN54982_c0_g1~~TRINITY_DN54982_c0_g1_i1.p1  ORF type:complete len:604 (+),score=142.89 TRINITY_DN54982_c0_g1_i1:146-1957(+)